MKNQLWSLAFIFVALTTFGQETKDSLSVLEKNLDEINARIRENPDTFQAGVPFTAQAIARVLGAKYSTPANSPNTQANILKFLKSRSLQKEKVELANPRQVGSVTLSDSEPSGTNPVPLVFFGHANKTGEIESISWNPEAKRYEFLQGMRSSDGTLSYKRADRNFCITCHQAEGPIFQHFPWSESEFNADLAAAGNQQLQESAYSDLRKILTQSAAHFAGAGQILSGDEEKARIAADKRTYLEKIEKDFPTLEAFKAMSPTELANFTSSFASSHSLPDADRQLLDARMIKLSSQTFQANNGSAFSVDGNVRQANDVLRTIDVCQRLCGDNEKCNRSLLAIALTGGLSKEEDAALVKQVKPLWPKDNFVRSSSVIPDVDPLDNPNRGGTAFVGRFEDTSKFLRQSKTRVNSNADTDALVIGDLLIPILKDNNASRREKFIVDQKINPVYDELQAAAEVETDGVIKKVRLPGRIGMADPKTPRPKIGPIYPQDLSRISNLSACFNIFPNDLIQIKRTDKTQLRKVILGSKRFQGLSAAKPWDKPKLVAEINHAIEDSIVDDTDPDAAPSSHSPGDHGIVATEQEKAKAMAIFKTSCAQCHAGPKAEVPLPLESLEKMQRYHSKDGESTMSLVDSNVMPPEGTVKAKISDEDRALLLRVLRVKRPQMNEGQIPEKEHQ